MAKGKRMIFSNEEPTGDPVWWKFYGPQEWVNPTAHGEENFALGFTERAQYDRDPVYDHPFFSPQYPMTPYLAYYIRMNPSWDFELSHEFPIKRYVVKYELAGKREDGSPIRGDVQNFLVQTLGSAPPPGGDVWVQCHWDLREQAEESLSSFHDSTYGLMIIGAWPTRSDVKNN